MMRHRCFVALAIVAIALLGVSSVSAQTLGTIQGYISGANGEALPGVTVVIRNTDTGAERTVISDQSGFYRAPGLSSSNYSVTGSLDGMQSTRQDGVLLQVGQVLDINLALEVESTSEVITVTGESPVLEISRSSAASYISQVEIEALPIAGRDFKQFALLSPTVQNDDVRGFITISGQRGIYSGLNIDGTSGKSAFFGYGRGGEATENDGLVVAQDSVKEFQIVTNGFAPEYGANGGGYMNVVTKGGTNQYKGTAFYQYRDDGFVEDIPSTPLDDSRGIDGSRKQSEFEDKNYGASFGGPIVRDQTHFFLTFDQRERSLPFTDDLRTRGAYDAVLQRAQADPRFLELLEGYTPNGDGVAAPDADNGRTATGLFTRNTDNLILFGKLSHQFSQSHTGTFQFNLTEYERTSDFRDEESLKTEDTDSYIVSLLSVIGENKVNEFRFASAKDDLGRQSSRVGSAFEEQIRFRFGSRDSLGKFDFLPIIAAEEKTQVQNNFSYLFGSHDLKFGIDYQKDDLAQLFAGSRDGRYDFATMDAFLNNDATQARIYFGNVQFPNYDESQKILGIYAQDSWRVNESLTVNYGLRFHQTDNPGNLQHLLPEGRDIPDDDSIDPRVGFAWTPGNEGNQVVRGGFGLFTSRTPTLLFASQVQENGLFPNFGRQIVRPGQAGFVPLGTPIDNENPPLTVIPSTSYVNPNFEDPETMRINLGYERTFADSWVASADLVYADGKNLQSNVEQNRTLIGRDQFGRPLYSSDRPNPNLQQLFVRESVGESEYTALTFGIKKRYNGKYQFQAHYTWAEDQDTDSNERSATSVTLTDISNPNYDFGLSDRDVENRFLVSGLYVLPFDIRLSGVFEYKDGTPYTALDDGFNVLGYPGANGPRARAIIGGQAVGRNTFRNESINRIDLRISKLFNIAEWSFELYGQAFNLLDENSFAVGSAQLEPFDGSDTNAEFGIPDNLVTNPRQFEVGVRIGFGN